MAPRARLIPIALAAAVIVAVVNVPLAFLPAPARAPAAASAAAAALAAAPLAAFAELPPLEDLPLDELNPVRTIVQDETWNGISFPMVFIGIIFAVSWAAFWVTNLTPKKEEEGVYKTYIGGGELPPEGYTNPLDPRVSEEYAQEDDPIYLEEKKGKKAAGSAII